VDFKLGTGDPPPDIIILQICSLSQDDMRAAALEKDAFWSGFDFLLTDFNTATAHSTPAALRLLRAACGQASHDSLYRESPAACSLFAQFRRLGYRTCAINDHDGTYEDFSASLQRFAALDAPLPVAGLPVSLVSFDGSPIYDDGAVLERWWRQRLASGGRSAAVFANLTPLHGGAHAPADKDWWRKSRVARYRERFALLANAVERLEAAVLRSHRRAIVLFVPEHGAALRGSSLQPADLREIPLPAITVAPVGLKLLGWNKAAVEGGQIKIERRTSYLGLAQLLAGLMRLPQGGLERAALQKLAAGLPESGFVSENQAAVVIEDSGSYYLKMTGKDWTRIPQDALPQGRSSP
jgi:cellulose synthase operon protein YhjU